MEKDDSDSVASEAAALPSGNLPNSFRGGGEVAEPLDSESVARAGLTGTVTTEDSAGMDSFFTTRDFDLGAAAAAAAAAAVAVAAAVAATGSVLTTFLSAAASDSMFSGTEMGLALFTSALTG